MSAKLLDTVGALVINEDRDLNLYLVEKNGRTWLVLDSGEERVVSVQAAQLPRLVSLVQRAHQQYCHLEAHTPNA